MIRQITQQKKGQPVIRAHFFLLSLLVGLTGCRLAASEMEVTPASEETVSSSQPSLTANPTPATALPDAIQEKGVDPLAIVNPLEKERISITGLGPIKLGMKIAAVNEAAQAEFVLAPGNQVQAECQYYIPADGSESLGLMVVDGRIIRIDIWPGSTITTQKGIGIGSTLANIRAQYAGDILETAPRLYTPGQSVIVTPASEDRELYQLVFEVDPAGKVVQFRTGQFPAVSWTEGCS